MSFYDKEKEGLTLHTSTLLEKVGAVHAFTTRPGGVSQGIYASLNLGKNRGDDMAKVRENYRRVCGALGVDMDRLVFTGQVHGDLVRTVTAADAGKGLDRPVDYQVDGLMTNVPGLVLTVFTADCIPILLYDPAAKVVAAVHAGWRGTALGIASRAVEGMVSQYGCKGENILAAIGPGISQCCFETDQDVPNAMTAALGSAALPFIQDRGDGKFGVDLKGLNALWLRRSGLRVENIDISPDCTMCQPDKYWSHRYTKGERGSQAALISLL